MKTRTKRLVTLAAALLCFFVVLAVLDESSYEGISDHSQQSSRSLPLVAYQSVSVTEEVLSIPAFGELKPKWDVLIKSQVNGEVRALKPTIEAGVRVQQGELLTEIDKTNYQAQVDRATLVLEQAKLELLEMEQRAELARSDWERSGLAEPPSDLMLFKPQLAVAKQNLLSAKSHHELALKSLSDTTIAAPFTGVIVERNFSKGQVIVEGETLFRLVDDQYLSLEVSLGELQWADLADDWRGQKVSLYSSHNKVIGQAQLVQGGYILDSESRQFRLFLTVPSDLRGKARAGQFVRVSLPGRSLPNILNLPESALSQDGSIWLVDNDNALVEYSPEYYYHHGDRIFAAPPKKVNNLANVRDQVWRVVVRPLSFFLPGKTVAPISAAEHPLHTLLDQR